MNFFSKIKKLFKQSKQSLKIYIDNFDLANRGNQLMIQSVIDQIRTRYSNKTQVFVCERVFRQNPQRCSSLAARLLWLNCFEIGSFRCLNGTI